jgi:hypothetical protein
MVDYALNRKEDIFSWIFGVIIILQAREDGG